MKDKELEHFFRTYKLVLISNTGVICENVKDQYNITARNPKLLTNTNFFSLGENVLAICGVGEFKHTTT